MNGWMIISIMEIDSPLRSLLPINFFTSLLQNTHHHHLSIQMQFQSTHYHHQPSSSSSSFQQKQQQQQQQQLVRNQQSLEKYAKESQVVVIHYSQGIMIMDTTNGRRSE